MNSVNWGIVLPIPADAAHPCEPTGNLFGIFDFHQMLPANSSGIRGYNKQGMSNTDAHPATLSESSTLLIERLRAEGHSDVAGLLDALMPDFKPLFVDESEEVAQEVELPAGCEWAQRPHWWPVGARRVPSPARKSSRLRLVARRPARVRLHARTRGRSQRRSAVVARSSGGSSDDGPADPPLAFPPRRFSNFFPARSDCFRPSRGLSFSGGVHV